MNLRLALPHSRLSVVFVQRCLGSIMEPSQASSSPPKVATVKRLMPITDWLPSYKSEWLRWDLVAGITLAAYAIPVSLAYASLAGVPPQMGLYCYLVGG